MHRVVEKGSVCNKNLNSFTGAAGKRETCLQLCFIISRQDINLSPAELLNLTYLGYYRVLE